MIGRLTGKIVEVLAQTALIDVNGVGYEMRCSRACLDRLVLGENTSLVVYTDVREDAITLYGFADQLERQVFHLLKLVNGVGSKTASDIISRIDKLELLRIIGSADPSALQKVKGIGKKLSERIVVELKEKVAEFALEARSSSLQIERVATEPLSDATEALKSLGFTAKDAERALRQAQVHVQSGDVGALIREALKFV